MQSKVNKIRNASFDKGQAGPRHWVWSASGRWLRWRRGGAEGSAELGGMIIESDKAAGSAWWSQEIACKPETAYRVEATVSGEVRCAAGSAEGEAGLVLAIEPVLEGKPIGNRRETPGLCRSSAPIAIRAYYETDENVRRVRVSFGLNNASGKFRVADVRFIEILEPEEESHALAIPPPPQSTPPPCVVKRVCVCSATADDRTLTQRLRECFGEKPVMAMSPRGFKPGAVKADAVLLPDEVAPVSLRSLSALVKLARGRVVVISLPAFARIAEGHVSLRRVEQADDPIHAKVAYANHASAGFALHDAFPYAWPGKTVGSFVHNQYRRTPAFKSFCKKHGFITLLESLCDQDVTSGRAVCLYKETSRGGLYVLDLDPLEAPGSTFAEAVPGMHYLLSLMGIPQTGMGQYAVPEALESQFRDLVRELDIRFAPAKVHDSGLPIGEVNEQLVTVGNEHEGFGLPLTPKPVILVRSGLHGGDVESVYGSFLWFKQFVRMPPHDCAYATTLASQFRLAWVPCVAPWESSQGWRRSGQEAAHPTVIETEDAELAALIDVVSRPVNKVRVVMSRGGETYRRYAAWLPRLYQAFSPPPYFAPGIDEERSYSDRDAFSWRHIQYPVEVAVDQNAFGDEAHRDAIASGADVIRIEAPGFDADFATYSIHRSDVIATVLELVIGLQFGLIAVNRTAGRVRFDGFAPVAPGEAIVVSRGDPCLRAEKTRAG